METKDAPPIIASIDADGKYYVSVGTDPEAPMEAVDAAVIKLKLEQNPDTPVMIKGSGRVSYQEVLLLMDFWKRRGTRGRLNDGRLWLVYSSIKRHFSFPRLHLALIGVLVGVGLFRDSAPEIWKWLLIHRVMKIRQSKQYAVSVDQKQVEQRLADLAERGSQKACRATAY